MGVRAATHRRSNRLLIGVTMTACVALVTACGQTSTTSAATTTPRATTATTRPQPAVSTPSRPASVAQSGGRLAAPVESAPTRIQIRHAPLTTQDWATYDYSTSTDTITASAPAGLTDMNVREIFWRTDATPAVDQKSCITWDQTAESVPGEPIQPGIATRIASTGPANEGIKAVTLTENVVYAGTWFFNVHVWDTTRPIPMTLLKTFDASQVVGRMANVDGHAKDFMAKPPWHLCARTAGNAFSFKIWTGNNPEPAWNDPHRVFTTMLPSAWVYPGYAGGYIGHLHPNQSATAELSAPRR